MRSPVHGRKVSTQPVFQYEGIARTKLLPSADFSRAGCGELAAGAHIPIPLPTRRFHPCEKQQFSGERLQVFPARASMARTLSHLTSGHGAKRKDASVRR